MQVFYEKSPNLFEVFAENACNSHSKYLLKFLIYANNSEDTFLCGTVKQSSPSRE